MPMPGPDPEPDADQSDPYVAWARMAHPDAPPPPGMAAAAPPVAPPPLTPPPGAGGSPSSPDQYAAWAGQPVTSPSPLGPAPSGPITSPEQLPAGGSPSAPEGPVTMPGEPGRTTPPNAYGSQDAFGGNVNKEDRAKALATMTPEDQAAAVASMTPDEFVAYKANRARATMLRQAELEHQANLDNERRAREDLEMHRAAAAKAEADTKDLITRADALANSKIDPDRFVTGLRQRGHFGLSVILQGIGGMVSAQTGGRNLALDTFQRRVDADIAAQHADIANRWRGIDVRKGAIADEYARTGDMYKAQETYRIGAYTSAINDIQSQLQQFDPAGGTAAMWRDQLDQFHTAQAQAINAFGQQQLKNNLDVAKENRERALANSTIAKNAAESAKLYSEASAAKMANQVMTPAEIHAQFPDLPIAAVPPIAMTRKELGQHIETFNKSLTTVKETSEAAQAGRKYDIGGVAKHEIDKDGNVIRTRYEPLVNAPLPGESSGRKFQAPNDKTADELRNQKGGVDVTSQFIDDMTSAIRKYGGSSKLLKSPEWQAMEANKESLLFALHQAYNVTGFRPGVLEQMEKALGGQDPTAYAVLQTKAIPGLETAKKDVLTHFNANLRASGYTGEEYAPESAPKGVELPKLSGRTATESEPGVLDKLHVWGSTPIGSNQPGTGPEAIPVTGPTGLSPTDTDAVQQMIKLYEGGTPATRERVAAALTAPLAAGRPSLNAGIVGLVRDENAALYRVIVKALPEKERHQEEAFVKARAALPKVTLPPTPRPKAED